MMLEQHAPCAVWHITESEEQLCSLLRHPEYYADKVSTLRHGSRRMLEVLAVRCALCQHMQGVEQRVAYDASGKPQLADSPLQLSISHTQDYAAVITSPWPVGIDIERRGNRVQRVVSHYLQPSECALFAPGIGTLDNMLLLHLAWSAKETAFKVLGNDYYDLLRLTQVTAVDTESHTLTLAVCRRNEPLLIHYDYTAEYVLTWCVVSPKM